MQFACHSCCHPRIWVLTLNNAEWMLKMYNVFFENLGSFKNACLLPSLRSIDIASSCPLSYISVHIIQSGELQPYFRFKSYGCRLHFHLLWKKWTVHVQNYPTEISLSPHQVTKIRLLHLGRIEGTPIIVKTFSLSLLLFYNIANIVVA